ncbi:hypothetical protein BDA96_03G190600 [Sorghum bicolor]|uniref:Uncharacterized protein n=2 Tax=Sorghum bicolor TaxID=4558 RepID=A0A921UQF0_SORBI|nr:hypothetical protein BDA96_03G190600 [Sorghum bicolor]KXG32620.1 hypothetical protein SORBI_3003G175800 [Sorghum bicolor]
MRHRLLGSGEASSTYGRGHSSAAGAHPRRARRSGSSVARQDRTGLGDLLLFGSGANLRRWRVAPDLQSYSPSSASLPLEVSPASALARPTTAAKPAMLSYGPIAWMHSCHSLGFA